MLLTKCYTVKASCAPVSSEKSPRMVPGNMGICAILPAFVDYYLNKLTQQPKFSSGGFGFLPF